MASGVQTSYVPGLGLLVCDSDGYGYTPHTGFTTDSDLPTADEIRIYRCRIPGYLYQTGSASLPCPAPAYYSLASTNPVRFAFMPATGGVYIVSCSGGSCTTEVEYNIMARAALYNGSLIYWTGVSWFIYTNKGLLNICDAAWPVYAPGDPALLLCRNGVALAYSDGTYQMVTGAAIGWWDAPVYADSDGKMYDISGNVVDTIDTIYGNYGDISKLVYFGKGYGGYKVYVLSVNNKPLPRYRVVYTDGSGWYSIEVNGSDEWRLVYPVLKSDGSSTKVWVVSR